MAHAEQRQFCERVQSLYPSYFCNKVVLDVGSLNINGSNRDLFERCVYVGIDVGQGRGVDIVTSTHEFETDKRFDVIISTECFEHDQYYKKSLKKIVELLKSGGLFLFTCATEGRPEHGTRRSSPQDAPLLKGDWADYYKNLTEKDIREAIAIDDIFEKHYFETNDTSKDLYFWGIKK